MSLKWLSKLWETYITDSAFFNSNKIICFDSIVLCCDFLDLFSSLALSLSFYLECKVKIYFYNEKYLKSIVVLALLYSLKVTAYLCHLYWQRREQRKTRNSNLFKGMRISVPAQWTTEYFILLLREDLCPVIDDIVTMLYHSLTTSLVVTLSIFCFNEERK